MKEEDTMQQLIEQFAAGGNRLRRAVEDLSGADLHARPGPGQWSIHELVIHLQDSDAVAIDRMKRVISEENPTLLAYDENLYVARLHYDAQSAEDAVSLFDIGRRQFARVLRRLPNEDFLRQGTHNESGVLSVQQLLQTYVNHLEHHLRFLLEKRQRLQKPLAL
jgi:uncharacterized damage-inducible protein DinB